MTFDNEEQKRIVLEALLTANYPGKLVVTAAEVIKAAEDGRIGISSA